MREDEEPGGTGEGAARGRTNPYPLPGQDWDRPDDSGKSRPPGSGSSSGASDSAPPSGFSPPSGFAKPPDFKKVPAFPGPAPEDDAPSSSARVLLDGGTRRRRRGPAVYVPFALVLLVVLVVAGRQLAGFFADSGDVAGNLRHDVPTATPKPQPPEPVSTVLPRVKGWKAVSSGKYGLTYDVPGSWRVKSPDLLIGFEDAGGKPTAAMSATAVFREGYCGEPAERAASGFNQYVDGVPAQVAGHAARTWAAGAYAREGALAPAVSLAPAETVRVGRVNAVHVRADVLVKAPGGCVPPRAVVHALAVPATGTAAGKTTVFVLFSDQGVGDAASPRDLKRIVGSVRPS
ncbi:hypothetical protein [Spirillospora sp. NBC_01491]|uniref:hypothetical protein n=1 Tax=Spirillospora sp. NBC_01491 TaxID=2976007 RepID=UPI002E338866|nr:hypothetical protein [Spirillospora sp. NBC_01491]